MSDKDKINEDICISEINNLRNLIKKYRQEYYNVGESSIPDEEYDRLIIKLESLEKQLEREKSIEPAVLDLENSPTQTVGALPTSAFNNLKHYSPMLSLNNAFHKDEVTEFDQKLRAMIDKNLLFNSDPKGANNSRRETQYTCELKIDGVAVNLIYEHGLLVKAITRGDGNIGEDITQNIAIIKPLPKKIQVHFPEMIEIRAEVYMPKDAFRKLNSDLIKSGQKIFANPRNAASGSLRQIDPNITASRNLELFCYGIGAFSASDFFDDLFSDHFRTLNFLKHVGFNINENIKLANSIDECLKFYDDIFSKRNILNYEIDGVVYKLNDINLRKALGYTSRAPRWAIAHKFPALEKTTIVEDIFFSVGRTGVLTPVAKLQPIEIGGAVITYATLHNVHELRRKDIRVGDSVILQRAGDVIPEIIKVILDRRPSDSKQVVLPFKCPICDGNVIESENGTNIKCVAGYKCKNQLIASIRHYVSNDAVNIEGFGEKTILQLVDNGILRDISDIYALNENDLFKLERHGFLSSKKLINEINSKKNIALHKFIYALGINGVGLVTAQEIAKHFRFLEELMESDLDKLVKIDNIGEITSRSIFEYFRSELNLSVINRILKFCSIYNEFFENHGANVVLPDRDANITNKNANILTGKVFLFTGVLKNFSRNEARDMLIEKGATVVNSISAKVNYLVVGENPGSKLTKIAKYNVKILNEDEFLKLINNDGVNEIDYAAYT